MINENNFIPFEITNDQERSENDDVLNSKYFCESCKKKSFTKKKYELDIIKFLIFSFLLFGSFFLLVIILTFSYIRNKYFKKINKDDVFIRARQRNNMLGLVLPQRIDTICLDCNTTVKIEKDSGDFKIVISLFTVIVVSVICFLWKSKIFSL